MFGGIRKLRLALLTSLTSFLFLLGSRSLLDVRPQYQSATIRSDLIERLDGMRLTEGRIAGLAYAPKYCRLNIEPTLRSLAKMARGQSRDWTPAALALLELASNNARSACTLLKEAASKGSHDPRVLSDLSAAFLEVAIREDNPDALIDALTFADQALALDSAPVEALFNRALVIHHLFPSSEAQKAWEFYLQMDPTSKWSTEARQYLHELRDSSEAQHWITDVKLLESAAVRGDKKTVHKLVSEYPQYAREYVENDLLSSRKNLDAALAISNSLRDVNGEHLTVDAVNAFIEAVGSKSQRSTDLEKGQELYRQGLHLYSDSKFYSALQFFTSSEKQFATGKSPMQYWAVLRLAMCEFQRFNYGKALDLANSLVRLKSAARYPSLIGRTLWLSGLIQGIQGRPREALASYLESRRILAALNEKENYGAVCNLIAECLRELGDNKSALGYHIQALRVMGTVRDPTRKQAILIETATTLSKMGKTSAALYFKEEALHSYLDQSDAVSRVQQLRRRASIYQELGKLEQAFKLLELARRKVAEIDDKSLQASLLGYILVAQGQICRQIDPQRAITFISDAIVFYHGSGYQQQLFKLYAERARAYRSLGSLEAEESDLYRALKYATEQVRALGSAPEKSSLLDDLRVIFDDMTLLQLKLGKARAAFTFAEAGRAHLEDTRTPTELVTYDVRWLIPRIQKRLTGKMAFVYYCLTSDKQLIWVIRRDAVYIKATDIVLSHVKDLVLRFQYSLANDLPDQESYSEALYQTLISPIEPLLVGLESLVIVPDRFLFSVPFSALRKPLHGKYLLENFSSFTIPNAALAIRTEVRPSFRDASNSWRVAFFADPEVSTNLFRGIQKLKQVSAETSDVAELYGERLIIFSGRRASKDLFVDSLSRYDVVQFSGHAIVNEAYPQNSALLFSPSKADDSGLLYAYELRRHRLTKTHLVLLLACDTLRSDGWESESVSGLARSFLVAGVPAVIGSLWRVEDENAKRFGVEFHRQIRAGEDISNAMRHSQLKLLLNNDGKVRPPAEWGTFVLVKSSI